MTILALNTLSWLIYAIYVVSTLHSWIVFLVFAGAVALFVVGFIAFIAAISEDEAPPVVLPTALGLLKRLGIAAMILVAVQIIVPNQKYLTIIAASEVGEMVANSEQVKTAGEELSSVSGEAIDLLRAYITNQTAELKAEYKLPSVPQSGK